MDRDIWFLPAMSMFKVAKKDLFVLFCILFNCVVINTCVVTVMVQSTSLFLRNYIVFGTVDIFVISQPKWLKFGVQAHLFKMIGHTNFQLSISCTFKVMKLLVEVKVEQNFDKN